MDQSKMRLILLRLEAASRDLAALVANRPKSRSRSDQYTLETTGHQVDKALEELEALGFKVQPLSKAKLPDRETPYQDPADEPTGQDDIDTIGRHVV